MTTGATRARLGFVVPSVNTVIEDELREMLPADVSYSCGRVTLGTGDTATPFRGVVLRVDDGQRVALKIVVEQPTT